eukprot:1869964-Pyramimonas_sp.AAC.1
MPQSFKTHGKSWPFRAFLEALLEASWAILGHLRVNFGRLGGLLARLMSSEAAWGASLGRLGALFECSRAVLEAILGVLKASWA